MRCWRNRGVLALLALALLGQRQFADPGYGAGRGPALPASGAVVGWTRPAQPRSFTPTNLYNYIDGAADLFLAYGFKGLETAEYAEQGHPDHAITVDVYDLGSPLHAFGVFAVERPTGVKGLQVGTQGYSSDGLLAFWKGSYYVKLALMQKEDEEAGRGLARKTADGLPGRVTLPEELRRLPLQWRVPNSERYVMKDALGHGFLSEMVSADYHVGKVTVTLNVADLATASQAKAAWQKLRDFEAHAGKAVTKLSGAGEECFAAREASHGEMLAARKGRFLVIAESEKASRKDLLTMLNRAVENAS